MTKSAGILRASATGALALALVGVGLISPIHSPASAAEVGVGEPQLALIESAHATGKTAVIGQGDVPLTSRTIATDPDAVVAQAVSIYPVDGPSDEYVFANANGQVLALASQEGGLQLLDLAPEEAASNPLAVWTMNSRDDRGMIVNGNSALNLFGWSTADGTEIGTYAPGNFGNNEAWRIHHLQGEVTPIDGIIAPGAAPTMPAEVTARYSWGPRLTITDIDWDMPSEEIWQQDGIVEFAGTAPGLYGDMIHIDASFTVGSLGDALESEMRSYAGASIETLKLTAPRTVERTVSGSDVKVTADVRWDWDALDPASLADEGEVTVPAVDGLGFAATLRITLTTPNQVNHLLTGARAWRMDGTTDLTGLTNGNRDAEGFGDWRSGGAANRINPNWVAYYFDRPREITSAALYEPVGADNIGTVTFQYRNMRGGWEDVSTGPITNDGGRLALTTEFDPVLATGFRVIIEHKSDASWMQLSEFEAWGPGL